MNIPTLLCVGRIKGHLRYGYDAPPQRLSVKLVAELFLHFHDGTSIPLRAFDGDEPPTMGKIFGGSDSVIWTFGRHPQWCDVVWPDPYVSAIHFTIFYDRTVGGRGEWLIHDGGFYSTPLKMTVPPGHQAPAHYSDEPRGLGYVPSTLGTFVNGERLGYTQPEEGRPAEPMRETLYTGYRIFAAGKKMYVTHSARPPKDVDWRAKWENAGETKKAALVTPTQAKELLAEQQSKVEATPTTGLGGGILAVISKRLEAEPPWLRALIYAAIAAVAFAFVLGLAGAAR